MEAALALYGILHQLYSDNKTFVPADLSITAPALTASFEGNEDLADSLYLYKVVSLSGVYEQLIDDGPGRYIIRLPGSRSGKVMVDCHIDLIYSREDLLLRTATALPSGGSAPAGG